MLDVRGARRPVRRRRPAWVRSTFPRGTGRRKQNATSPPVPPLCPSHRSARPAAVPLAPLRLSCRCASRTAPPFGAERTFCTGRGLNGSTALTPRQRQEVRSAPPVCRRPAARAGLSGRAGPVAPAGPDWCACRAGLVRAALPGSLLRRLLLRGGFLPVADPGGAGHLAPVAGQRRDVGVGVQPAGLRHDPE